MHYCISLQFSVLFLFVFCVLSVTVCRHYQKGLKTHQSASMVTYLLSQKDCTWHTVHCLSLRFIDERVNSTSHAPPCQPHPTDQSEARTEIHHRHMSHTHTGFNETQTMWTCYTEMQRVTSCVLMYICALC